MDTILFPFSEYWWFYVGFAAAILALLAFDLGLFHRQAHAVSFREAAVWSTIWFVLAMGFNVALFFFARWKFPLDPRLAAVPGFDADAAAWQTSLEFLTGYIIELSLSVDNIFIFVLVFGYFAIPSKYQHRVLFYGILGAIVFRAAFIVVGSALMKYHWVIVLFGVFLILTGLKMMIAPEQGLEPNKNPLIRLFRRFVPLTPQMHEEKFFVRLNNIWHATPLMVALIFLEVTDVIFAVDSVPAIFALTNEPLIVFTSNIFAILGLRSLYFLLAGAVDKFHLLKFGLAVVLIFVGLKMSWLNSWFGGKFPISYSLGFIASVLVISIVLSLSFPKQKSPAADSRLQQVPAD